MLASIAVDQAITWASALVACMVLGMGTILLFQRGKRRRS